MVSLVRLIDVCDACEGYRAFSQMMGAAHRARPGLEFEHDVCLTPCWSLGRV